MAKKVIALKEPTILTLKFLSGKEVDAVFTMKTIRILGEEFENVTEILMRAASDIFGSTAKLLYAAIKAAKNEDEDISYDDVTDMVEMMSIDDVSEIFEICTEGLGSITANDSLKKTMLELLAKK